MLSKNAPLMQYKHVWIVLPKLDNITVMPFLCTDTLYYGAPYELRNDKKETYSVEGVNAELRHYLKRLARRSRCFSRCPYALKCAIRLLVFCYNQRQLWKRLYPAYPANLIDFLHTQV